MNQFAAGQPPSEVLHLLPERVRGFPGMILLILKDL